MAKTGVRPIGRSHQPLREVIAEEIKSAIVSGRLQPGERLVEDRLAEELGVSRNPVREALRILGSQGFVEVVPRRGASVADLSAKEGHDLFEVRRPLEALAARLAATRATRTQIEELERLLDRGLTAAGSSRSDGLPELNTAFHQAIIDIAGNPHLSEVVRSLRDRIQWIYSAGVQARGPHSWEEHRAIFEAISQGDPDLAAVKAEEHIRKAEAAFIGETRDDAP